MKLEMRRRIWLLAGLSASVLACSGTSGHGGHGGNDEPGDDGFPPPSQEVQACAADEFPTSLLRRLTRREYDNTVRDLLGYEGNLASGFPEDEKVRFFDANSIAPVTDLVGERYMRAAETLATFATENLSKLLPCDPAVAGDSECARSFVEQFGSRAFRRPLEESEIALYMKLYDRERSASEPFAEGISLIVQTMLQSPHFLYRSEMGAGPPQEGLQRLGAHEFASRMSYFLWGSMPDEELMEAAAKGDLFTPKGLEAQALRLLNDPRARSTTTAFHRQWLGIERFARKQKDEAIYPGYSASIAASLEREFARLVEHVFHEGDGSLRTLFTAPYTFVEADVAKLYRISGVAAEGATKVEDETPRAGVLTQGAVLAYYSNANQTSPVQRGYFIRKHVLCQDPPPPPADVATDPPPFDPKLPTRQRFSQHRDNAACRACHEILDPLGFGLENFDAIGRHRAEDGGEPIDTSGEIVGTDVDGTFDGPMELGARLGDSTTVKECVARQWSQFALARSQPQEMGCAAKAMQDALMASDGDLRQGLLALVKSAAFRMQRAEP